MPEKIDLLNLSFSEIDNFLNAIGLSGYRASQVKKWIFKEGITSFSNMSNISKSFRSLLHEKAFINRLTIEKILSSSDKTKKYIFALSDKNFIESVLIPERKRRTLCISTQVGCARGCRFCLTGKSGFQRNLTSAEILNQILEVKRDLGGESGITNIVIMGMGEPLENFENVKRAVEIMSDRDGFDFSSRRITLSTCGVITGLKKMMESGLNISIAVSLNAPNDVKRGKLMPVNRLFPLKELIKVIRDYPLKKRSMITFEYILIKDFNDSIEDAHELVQILKGLRAKINLLNFNYFSDSEFQPSPPERVLEFQSFLKSKKITVNLRKSRGGDILAACGQLGGESINS